MQKKAAYQTVLDTIVNYKPPAAEPEVPAEEAEVAP
jgi:hypothetical protein